MGNFAIPGGLMPKLMEDKKKRMSKKVKIIYKGDGDPVEVNGELFEPGKVVRVDKAKATKLLSNPAFREIKPKPKKSKQHEKGVK